MSDGIEGDIESAIDRLKREGDEKSESHLAKPLKLPNMSESRSTSKPVIVRKLQILFSPIRERRKEARGPTFRIRILFFFISVLTVVFTALASV